MATTYESLLPEILPMVPGCPDALVIQNIRSAVIELCERASVYQHELDPISTVSSVYEYEFDAPLSTSVHKIVWGVLSGDALEPVSSGMLEQRVPDWRNQTGTPEYIIKNNLTTFWIAPVPSASAANSLIIRVALKPTYTSVSCDDTVMSDYRDTIINGTVGRLLRMPAKEWSDVNSASVYYGFYNEGVVAAEQRARRGDTPAVGKVEYGGLTSSKRRYQKYAGRRLSF